MKKPCPENPGRADYLKTSADDLVAFDVFFNELDNIAGGGSRGKKFGSAGGFEGGDVFFGNNAAAQNQDVVRAFFLQKFGDRGKR